MHNAGIIKGKMINYVHAYRGCLTVVYSMEKEGRKERERQQKD